MGTDGHNRREIENRNQIRAEAHLPLLDVETQFARMRDIADTGLGLSIRRLPQMVVRVMIAHPYLPPRNTASSAAGGIGRPLIETVS
jgi:hypothetical protein